AGMSTCLGCLIGFGRLTTRCLAAFGVDPVHQRQTHRFDDKAIVMRLAMQPGQALFVRTAGTARAWFALAVGFRTELPAESPGWLAQKSEVQALSRVEGGLKELVLGRIAKYTWRKLQGVPAWNAGRLHEHHRPLVSGIDTEQQAGTPGPIPRDDGVAARGIDRRRQLTVQFVRIGSQLQCGGTQGIEAQPREI